MSIVPQSFLDRMMLDGHGLLKDEFLEYMRVTKQESQTTYDRYIQNFRRTAAAFILQYEDRIFKDILDKIDLMDLLNEINRLRVLLKEEPKNDHELYEQHVYMLRLISLSRSTFALAEAEDRLQLQILLGKLKKDTFIF